MKITQRILRFLDPRKEKERMDFRECVAMTQARAMDLDHTMTLNRDELMNEMRHHGVKVVHNEVSSAVQFSTYAAICKFRYAPEHSMMRICKHPEHEASATGLAACRLDLCPRMREAAKGNGGAD